MATIRQIQTIFSKLNIREPQIKERINAWTSGRTSSLKELDPIEIEELYESLKSKLEHQKEQEKADKRAVISSILTIATRNGIKHPDNWDSFNYYMLHKSLVKKSLRLCSIEELNTVLKQFRALEQNNNKSAQKLGTKAYFQQFGLPKISKN